MTTELDRQNGRASSGYWGQAVAGPSAPGPGTRETPLPEHRRASGSEPRRTSGSRAGLLSRHPAWPIVALLAGYPIWWALGIADYMFIVLAVPMAVRLYTWRSQGRRLLRLPPGFSLWLLFLICMLAGAATLGLTAPGTISSSLGNRIVAFGDRGASYLAVTVLLLFAGNLTERELSRRRLAWLLGLVGIYAIIGGFAGIVFPNFQLTSPLVLVMPVGLQNNTLVQSMLHPALTQVQGILGEAEGRPKAPFDYTNSWGDSLTILLPWLLVAWWATRRQRRKGLAVAALALVPLIYSLDRGVWIGIAVTVIYLAVRFAARGKLGLLAVVGSGAAVVIFVILVSPLHSLIGARLTSEENSNTIRASLNALAVRDAIASPLIGYGDERHQRGSAASIAIGPTPACSSCGQAEAGSTGQFWLLLVCDGFLGTALYLGFFAYGMWRYRRDMTPYGLAGVLVLLLSFVYMFTYDAVVAPLAFTMLAYALLWRNDIQLRNPDPESLEPAAGAGPGGRRNGSATRRALT
jgi:hypothetical protein